MLKSKKNKFAVLLSAVSILSLASCSSDPVKLPDDYSDNLFPDIPGNSVVQDTKEDYYNNLTDSDKVYENTVNQILLALSDIAHDNKGGTDGSSVVNVINDDYDGSVADGTIPEASTADNLLNRAEQSLVDIAGNGTYEKDNLFRERLYVDSLLRNLTLTEDPLNGDNPAGVLVTPGMEFDDIFAGDKNIYHQYMEDNLYDDMRINYLVTEYIYKKSYASIGNTNARKVEIIGLTDREDRPGAAKNLLDAYVNDYVFGEHASSPDAGFKVLSKLWKGITSDVVSQLTLSDENRYKNVELSEEETTWLADNHLLSAANPDTTYHYNYTLSGKVMDDKDKLDAGRDDMNLLDTSLESTYTGSYTYDYNTGVRMAIDDIATANYVTDGIYLQSDGVSGLPDSINTRVFSTNYDIDEGHIKEMKDNPGTIKYDITTYGNDGYRYLTVPNTVASSGSSDHVTPDDIIFYDKDSRTYYLVRILDVVNTQSMSTNENSTYNSIYSNDAAKREQIAREVAYTMSTTGSYKTEAVVYWLSRTNINYSDEDFLEYMKTNYPELFRTDSPYADEPKITLPSQTTAE